MLRKLKLFLFLIFILVTINIANAEFNTRVNFYEITDNGDFISQNLNNIILTYYLSSGEKILKSYDNAIIFNPEKELFCWSECNIVPDRYISKIDIRNETDLLSRQTVHIGNEDINQMISIFLDKKINLNENYDESSDDINIDFDLLNDGDTIIDYIGILNVIEEGNYTFLVNITGGSNVFIDDTEISKDASNKTFSLNLDTGNHSFKITYWSDKNSKPNLFWKINNKFEKIPTENLIFINGSIKNKPQIQKNKMSTLSIPESYTPDYSAYPSYAIYNHSITDGRIPLLLVHGLHGTYPYWNDIPSQLTALDNDVWEVYYSPANSSNFLNAGLLKNAINEILQNYSTSKVDVVSHSMGGFVTLGYIQNLGQDSNGTSITHGGNIRKYIPIAAPFHGNYISNRILREQSPIATCPIFDLLKDPRDTRAQAYLDLAFGSEFTWILSRNAVNNEVDYLSITGNEGIACIPDETKESNSGEPDDSNDGFVAISSASLLDKNISLIILDDYNHANEIGDSAVPGFSFNAQRQLNIINSFIKGDDIGTLKSYLGQDDHYIDPNNDSTNPYTKGSAVLKFTRNKYINSVGLKNTNTDEYYNLTIFEDTIHNTSTYNWFYFSSNNPDMAYSNQKYGLTFPAGTYDLYVNNVKENNKIKIKPAQTTMQLTDLDYDKDGINDSIDKCYTEGYDNLPNNNSYIDYYLDEDGCHAGILIKNLSTWSTYNKDSKLSAVQSGTSAFDIGYANKTVNNGSIYQPLVADIDADLVNEIIIFSKDYLMIFDDNLNLIKKTQAGTLRGQPDIINYDNDPFLEVIAVLQNNNSDNYTVIEYNGTNFNIEQSFDITSQGGYQNIKCLDFDKDSIIDCIFKDYNGYLHSYNINSNNDNLGYKVGEGTSSNSPAPAFADFDNDNDLDLLIEHNYNITLIDKDKNARSTSIADEYGTFTEYGNFVIYCSNKKKHLRFANLTGNLSIVWAGSCDRKEQTVKMRSKLIALNNDLTKRFVKECRWISYSCVTDKRIWRHACKYNDPLIYDYDNDGFDEIIITHEINTQQTIDNDELGIEIEIFNASGGLIYSNEIRDPKFEYGDSCRSLGMEGASYADMDNDNNLDLITIKGIFNLSLTNITSDFGLETQQPIPADINQDGFLDLIWSKPSQTKIFISEARPSCSDKIKNQNEIDIDCGGVCGICFDSDNDGIVDMYDKLYGNSSNITTNFGLILVFIGNSLNITKRFNTNQLIDFKKNNKSILYFNFDFSLKTLNLSKIIINKQTDNKTGYILVKGVNATGTKTVYLDNLNASIKTICIKDSEIGSIGEISSYCNESNEFLIKCNSREYFGYNCSNSSSHYKITGLSHSGVKQQQDTIKPSFAKISLNNPNAKINEIVMWNATLTDNLELSAAWFSTNDSKQWINHSPSSINRTSFDINFNETINSSRGSYVCGMFYMNDSAGNTGKTNSSCFFVANTAPTTPTDLTADNNKKVGENIYSLCTDSTDADNEAITYYYEFYNLNDSAIMQVYSDNSLYTIQTSDVHDQIRARCKASDGINESGEDEIIVSIANTAPVLDNINNVTATEADTINITANATDADNDNLVYYINNTNFNQTGNSFLWATDYDDAGLYSIKITAADGNDNDSKIFYVLITDAASSSGLETISSSTGSTYSSRGIFLKEDEEETSAKTEEITDHSENNSSKKEREASYQLKGDNLDNSLKEKIKNQNKLTGNTIAIPDKPSKPIGITITFGIVFFGLFFYNVFNRK